MLEKELLLTISGSCSFSSLLQWNAMEHGMEHGNGTWNMAWQCHGKWYGNGTWHGTWQWNAMNN